MVKPVRNERQGYTDGDNEDTGTDESRCESNGNFGVLESGTTIRFMTTQMNSPYAIPVAILLTDITFILG